MKIKVIKPDFYDKFQCLKGDCKYSCCCAWKIHVNKEEFDTIRKLKKSDELNEIAKTAFFTEDGKSFKNTASIAIRPDEDYKCPFLNECNTCRMWDEFGEDAIPNECLKFPHEIFLFASNVEKNLSSGCEEVVKYLFEQKNGIKIISEEENIDKSIAKRAKIAEDFSTLITERPILSHMYDYKMFLLTVLQARQEYSLRERMLIMGLAMKDIQEIDINRKTVETDKFIGKFFDKLESPEFKKQIKALKADDDVAVETGLVFDFFLRNNNTNKITLDFVKQMFDNFEAKERIVKKSEEDQQNGEKKESYKMGMDFNKERLSRQKRRFNKFFKDREYIFENIMVNHFLCNNYPFCNFEDIWDNYATFALVYNIYKTSIMAYLETKTTDEEIIKLIVDLSRYIIRGKFVLQILTEKLRNDFKDMDEMELLAKIMI